MKMKKIIMDFTILCLVLFGSRTSAFIIPTYDASFSAYQHNSIQQAVWNWEAMLGSTQAVSINFVRNDALEDGVLGETDVWDWATYKRTGTSQYYDQPRGTNITLNCDDLWWDDSWWEYHTGEVPPEAYDGTTTVMHEICHALGFTAILNPDSGFADFVTEVTGLGKVWTDGTMTIDLDDDHMTHTVQGGLMYWNANPDGLGTRYFPETYHAQMLVTSYESYFIPEPGTMVLLGLGSLALFRRRRR